LQIAQDNYNEKCDVYSYSIVAWEIFVRLKPYFHLIDPSSAQIMFGVIKGTCRPKPISKCPPIIEMLLKNGMDSDSSKRPSMQAISNLMENLDALINKTPIQPIVKSQQAPNIPTPTDGNANSDPFDSMKSSKNTIQTVIKGRGSREETRLNTSDLIREAEKSQEKYVADEIKSEDLVRFQSSRLSFNLNSSQLAPIKTHRRTKSYGNDIQDTDSSQTKNNLDTIEELSRMLELMIYDPIKPLYDQNESLSLFNNHLMLIKEDDKLQKKINEITQQKEQLETTIKNLNNYNYLLKQKNLILKENQKLRNIL
jgi:hypothetical protein